MPTSRDNCWGKCSKSASKHRVQPVRAPGRPFSAIGSAILEREKSEEKQDEERVAKQTDRQTHSIRGCLIRNCLITGVRAESSVEESEVAGGEKKGGGDRCI